MNKEILIVDDDENFARSINRVLKQQGYTTSIAYSGFEAGVSLAQNPPNLLTLDLNMPQFSGSEVLKMVKNMDNLQHTKILMISATTEDHMQQLLTEGVDGYLIKPFENDELIEKVRDLLESK
jgi:DNA-binding response OmpR family regulator